MSGILIVDDSAVMRRNLRLILENAGYEVVGEAPNGKKAYTSYKEFKPDVVTMDIAMPDIDGVTVTKTILDDFPDARIIMVSSLAQKAMVYDALKNGAKNYLIKPIDPMKLVKVVNDVITAREDEANQGQNDCSQLEQKVNDDKIFSFEENGSDGFRIKISSKLNDYNYPMFISAMDMMCEIKPSHVFIDFEGNNFTYVKGLEDILGIMQRLKSFNTKVFISCEETNEEIIKYFQNNGIGFITK